MDELFGGGFLRSGREEREIRKREGRDKIKNPISKIYKGTKTKIIFIKNILLQLKTISTLRRNKRKTKETSHQAGGKLICEEEQGQWKKMSCQWISFALRLFVVVSLVSYRSHSVRVLILLIEFCRD